MTPDADETQWYTVRCVFRLDADEGFLYEERVTLWFATDVDDAISLAEDEASTYAEAIGSEYLGFAQAFSLDGRDAPVSSDEIFSLMRASDLSPDEYLDRFFDTGQEIQSHFRE